MRIKSLVAFSALFLSAITMSYSGCNGDQKQSAEVVVLSYGGEFADHQRAAYYEPFAKETSIRVNEASYDGEYGKLKAAVESGNVPWDVADIESSALLRGVKDNLFTKIDPTKVNTTDLFPQAVHPYAIATDFYSVSLGYNTNKFPSAGRHPSNWKDFWDVTTFPGPRALKKDPRFTLEIALMADGVPLDKVYEGGKLDLDRAFKSLDRIKPHVKVWWTSGQQPIQLVADGEVVMAAAYGARMFVAVNAEKKPIGVSWDQGIVDVEYWAVLRGARHVDEAFRFIDFASRADRQAAFSNTFPLGPVNRRAFENISSERAQQLNTSPENFRKQLLLSAQYWADNEQAVVERFNQWLGK
jgi:putative spermidine/putrescine transport system substrate-binding protein